MIHLILGHPLLAISFENTRIYRMKSSVSLADVYSDRLIDFDERSQSWSEFVTTELRESFSHREAGTLRRYRKYSGAINRDGVDLVPICVHSDGLKLKDHVK